MISMQKINVILVRLLVLLLFFWVQIQLCFSDLGYFRYQKINQQVLVTEQLAQQVEEENIRLSDTVKNLRNNPLALTHNAREHLGMIGPGETMYRVNVE